MWKCDAQRNPCLEGLTMHTYSHCHAIQLESGICRVHVHVHVHVQCSKPSKSYSLSCHPVLKRVVWPKRVSFTQIIAIPADFLSLSLYLFMLSLHVFATIVTRVAYPFRNPTKFVLRWFCFFFSLSTLSSRWWLLAWLEKSSAVYEERYEVYK